MLKAEERIHRVSFIAIIYFRLSLSLSRLKDDESPKLEGSGEIEMVISQDRSIENFSFNKH